MSFLADDAIRLTSTFFHCQVTMIELSAAFDATPPALVCFRRQHYHFRRSAPPGLFESIFAFAIIFAISYEPRGCRVSIAAASASYCFTPSPIIATPFIA